MANGGETSDGLGEAHIVFRIRAVGARAKAEELSSRFRDGRMRS